MDQQLLQELQAIVDGQDYARWRRAFEIARAIKRDVAGNPERYQAWYLNRLDDLLWKMRQRPGVQPNYPRVASCWNCHQVLSTYVNFQCPFCGWLVCACGKCKGGCERGLLMGGATPGPGKPLTESAPTDQPPPHDTEAILGRVLEWLLTEEGKAGNPPNQESQ